MASKEEFVVSGGEISGDFTYGTKSLGEFILNHLTLGGHNTIFINGTTGTQISFSEFKIECLKWTNCLKNFGIQKNDVVSIVMENRVKFVAISVATIFLGAIVAPLNFEYKKLEFEHDLKILKPRLIITTGVAKDIVTKLIHDLKLNSDIIQMDKSTNFPEELLKFTESITINDDFVPDPVDIYQHPAVILFTSGTSGLPKGAQLTHANLMVFQDGTKTQRELMRTYYNDTMRVLTVAPFFHAMGFLIMIQNTFAYDAVTVFMERFNDHGFLMCIERYKINMLIVVPPLLVFLTKTEHFNSYDLSSLKEIMCGSSIITDELELAVTNRFNGNIFVRQVYGMTESSATVTMRLDCEKPGSVGTPIKGIQIKVIDDCGVSLEPFQKGEICLRGSRIMKGYYGDEKATSETIDDNDWLHTGDVGYYDNQHTFYFVERKKELIKFNAFQVPPAEIEQFLTSHPKIKDAGVIGIPDIRTGEKALAFVAKQPEVQLTQKEVFDFVADHLSRQKHLYGGVRFISEIPRNIMGKLLRRNLQMLYNGNID